tara:strand:+ start:56 stop:532 length:477 start_codon:yes stop_codon:yes gene_type:complete
MSTKKSNNAYVYSTDSAIDQVNNIVEQSKDYSNTKVTQPILEALSIFFMTALWVFGTLICSKVTIVVFGYYNRLFKNTPILNNLFFTIILHLVFISMFLYVFERNIFYPVVKFLRNEQQSFISDYGILTSATIGITLGMNIPQLTKKLRKLVRILHHY